MSLCDVCTRPGRCCTGFQLNSHLFTSATTGLEALAALASVEAFAPDKGPDATELGLPFLPLWRRPDGVWSFWCPVLTREGRCGDYENRPFPCRSFEPGSDTLCALATNAITASLHVPRLTA